MGYRVEIAPAAGRDLKRIPASVRGRLEAAVSALRKDARPTGSKKIAGRERSYRVRAGPFRIVYEVFDEERLVVIARVVRRSESTYRRLP